MKNTGKCTKCGGEQILRIPNKYAGSCAGNIINLSNRFFPSNVPVTRYLCPKCGFSEDWVEEPSDLEDLRKKYLGKET
jgi:predicted nucleic-acid-binding Zn-ribbon protein